MAALAGAQDAPESVEPLHGVRVVDLSTTLPGAICTQFLADSGADVLMLEPPEGSPLRALRGWPMLGRGKRSRVVDLKASGVSELDEALRDADVVVTTFSPAGLANLGIDSGALLARHPQLVISHITGWGRSGPWRGSEGVRGARSREGRTLICRASHGESTAAELSHGSLCELCRRTHCGARHLGRPARAASKWARADRRRRSLRGVQAIDAWNWFGEMVGIRWPEAYHNVEAWSEDGSPQSPMLLALLAAPTKDGHWLQFAQVSPHLFAAMLTEFGVMELLADPTWKGFPALEDPALYKEFWSLLLSPVGERTLAEWQRCFDENPNLCAELFRSGPQVLDHPQLVHERRSVVVDDPEVGPVRQPTTLIHTPQGPLRQPAAAPRLGDAGEVRPSGQQVAQPGHASGANLR